MRYDTAIVASSLIERINDVEGVILKLEKIKESANFKLIGYDDDYEKELSIEFKKGHLSTEIFKQNIIEYTINNLNIELVELRNELEELN